MRISRWFTENVSFGEKSLRATQQQLTDVIIDQSHRLAGKQCFNNLWDKTLHCKEPGVSRERLCDEEVVVSLTSYGERINEAHLAIESIMQQTVKPNRIILWLSEDEFKGRTLPVALQMQQERGLEIDYCEDLKSYKKLIPSLQRFPKACIITIDDDLAYNPDILERLVNAHIDNPAAICSSRMHQIGIDECGKLKSYKDWQICIGYCPEDNNLAFFTTGGGTLFPPHCFIDEIFNKECYMDLCGMQDDVWFNAMRLLSGVRVAKVFSTNPKGDFTPLPSSEINPMWIRNKRGGLNDNAISSIYGRYGLLDVLKNG